MKWFVFTVIFLFIACEGFDLDNGRDRSPKKDSAKGSPVFELPEIEDLNEVRENKDECSNYENHTSRSVFLGKNSWANPIVNCIAYNVDNGLKPLCEAEELAKEALSKTRDDYYAEEIEIYLDELEYEKELFVDYIYDLADPVYDYCANVEDVIDDEIDEIRDSNSRIAGTLVGLGADVLINSECRRIYRVMESKANLACINLDFTSFKTRRR